MPCLIIVIHSQLIAHHGLQPEGGFTSQSILTLQSFLDFAKLNVPFF
jgi:hypothetical protein